MYFANPCRRLVPALLVEAKIDHIQLDQRKMNLLSIETRFTPPDFAEPVLLIRDGRVIRRNLKRALMSPEELTTRLRRSGIRTLSSVSMCVLNPDGEVSVFLAS